MTGHDLHEILTTTYVEITLTIAAALVLRIIVRGLLVRFIRHTVVKHKYSSATEEKQREDTLIGITVKLSTVVIAVVAVIIILDQLNVNLAAMLTGLGAFSILVGFGAQNTIRNYLAGFFILLENQYRIDDIVGLYANGANIFGVVEDVTLRITRLRDLDGNLHIVQNGDASPVTNMSLNWSNVNVDVGIGYDDDLDTAIEVMNRVGIEQAGDPAHKANIVEPIQFYRVNEFADNAVMLKAVGKVHPATQWSTAGDFRYRIKKAFDEANIDIPVGQMVVRQPRPKTSRGSSQAHKGHSSRTKA